MTRRAEFLFDFGSPNAYLSHLLIPGVEQRTGATFEYVPILLGGVFQLTNNKSPFESFRDIKNKPEFLNVEMQRFLRKNKIQKYQRNPFFPVNTLQLMRGATAMLGEPRFVEFVDLIFHNMWVEPKKMDDPKVYEKALADGGFDPERMRARSSEPEVKAKLLATTQAAVERGVFGSPTFFVGSEMFFGKDQLRDVEEELASVTAG